MSIDLSANPLLVTDAMFAAGADQDVDAALAELGTRSPNEVPR